MKIYLKKEGKWELFELDRNSKELKKRKIVIAPSVRNHPDGNVPEAVEDGSGNPLFILCQISGNADDAQVSVDFNIAKALKFI